MLKDFEFDNVLCEAFAERLAETPDWQGELSLKYRRRFKQILADPWGYFERWQETPGPKLRRWAVAAILLLVMAGSSFFCLPQMWASAVNLLTRIYDGYNGYSFFYTAPLQEEIFLPEIKVDYIPEGYTLYADHTDEIRKHTVLDYKNADGDYLSIYIDVNENNLTSYNDNEHYKLVYTMLDNGQQAILLKGESEEWGNMLLWTNTKGDICLQVSGKITEKELFNIANNIKLK